MGERAEKRPMERVGIGLARIFEGLMLGGWSRYRPIAGDAVAAAMLTAARHGEPGKHTYQYGQICALAAESGS